MLNLTSILTLLYGYRMYVRRMEDICQKRTSKQQGIESRTARRKDECICTCRTKYITINTDGVKFRVQDQRRKLQDQISTCMIKEENSMLMAEG